ncbi:MAG: prepilin-type N-terminal cleavage/methylation domain-containing protein [Kosmotoga sp.]|nr:MAG: prepilin-type N-terminal cleavage/methylation domain-containing protein [Kosmotoga sp.]
MKSKGFTLVEVLVGLAITSIIIVGLMDLFGKFTVGNIQFCNSTKDVLAINRAFDLFERDMDRFISVRGQIKSTHFSYDTSQDKGNSWITYEIQNNTIRRIAKEPKSRQGINIILTFNESSSFGFENNILTFEIDGFERSMSIDWSENSGKRETNN